MNILGSDKGRNGAQDLMRKVVERVNNAADLEMLTPKQIVGITQLSLNKVYELIRTGKIPAKDVSDDGSKKATWRVRVADLKAWQSGKREAV